MPPNEVEELGASDVDLLRRYWMEEPWGPWRDNLHAALIAREVRRANFQGRHELLDFMVIPPEKRQATFSRNSLFDFFKSIAKRVKKDSAS